METFLFLTGSLAANSSKFEKKKSSAAAITLVVIVTVLLKLIGVTLFCKHVLVRYNNKKRERQKREALERLQRSQNGKNIYQGHLVIIYLESGKFFMN